MYYVECVKWNVVWFHFLVLEDELSLLNLLKVRCSLDP